jgi:hypothetical protein
MKQLLDAAAEERARAGPPTRLGPGKKKKSLLLGFARKRRLRSIKNLSPSPMQGLGSGILILRYD